MTTDGAVTMADSAAAARKTPRKTTAGKAAARKTPEKAPAEAEPKRTRMTQAERNARSANRMYEAAMQLIVERGTHNTTLKEVGELAGYSRGLAGNRFGSKEALFSALVVYFNKKWAAELWKFVGGRTGLAAFCAALDAVEHYLETEPVNMKAMYTLWYESIGSHNEVRERLAANHRAYKHDVEQWLREGIEQGFVRPYINPSHISVQFLSFISGTIYQWLVDPEAIDVKQAFADYRQITLDAITERRRAPRP